MTELRIRTRLKVLAGLIVCMFAVITTRLWFLQVLASEQFVELANQNQVRLVPIDPVRGQVLDRTGRVLVGNRPSTVMLIDRTQMEGREEEVLLRLSSLLGIPVSDFVERLNSVKYLPYQPVPVAEDVDKETIFYLEEHQSEFPGVSYRVDAVREYPVRTYAGKTLAAHLLGYVGEVSAAQLEQPEFGAYGFGDVVGKAGVEAGYERYLHGVPGRRGVQVNAQGRVLNDNFAPIPPKPGDNLILSIDTRVQDLAERSLAAGIEVARGITDLESGRPLQATGGAVVVMDPRNGQVVAMASNPTYDASVFLGGLTEREFAPLNDPDSNHPLFNRAIQSAVPPGSTFKPFIAAAGLRERLVRMNEHYECPPTYSVPGALPGQRPFNNWSPVHHGYITLAESLVISCDTVYYPMGWQFWLKYFRSERTEEVLQNHLRRMGFGLPTGLDVPGEISGVIGTQEYKRDLFRSNPQVYCQGRCDDDERWYPGDYVNMSIGQGFVQVTPIQLAVAFSALANGGTLWEPHVGLRVETPDGRIVKKIEPKSTGTLPLSKRQIRYLREAMVGVTVRGTASSAFTGFPLSEIPVAGKTGTAELDPKQPYSWFAAMAPSGTPRYVVVAMVEQGGHGSTTAAPIVRRMLEGLFGVTATKIEAQAATD